MKYRLALSVAFLSCFACGSDDAATTPAGMTASGSTLIAGVTIPATLPTCTGGGSFTAISNSTVAGFSWSAYPAASGGYAIKFTKAPLTGAGSETVILEQIFPMSDTTRKVQVTTVESNTYYSIRGVALDGTTPLCYIDGVNGISKP